MVMQAYLMDQNYKCFFNRFVWKWWSIEIMQQVKLGFECH